MTGLYIVTGIGCMALCGVAGFICSWLQGHVEAARQQTDRLQAQKQFNEARSRLVQAARDDTGEAQCGGACDVCRDEVGQPWPCAREKVRQLAVRNDRAAAQGTGDL